MCGVLAADERESSGRLAGLFFPMTHEDDPAFQLSVQVVGTHTHLPQKTHYHSSMYFAHA